MEKHFKVLRKNRGAERDGVYCPAPHTVFPSEEKSLLSHLSVSYRKLSSVTILGYDLSYMGSAIDQNIVTQHMTDIVVLNGKQVY